MTQFQVGDYVHGVTQTAERQIRVPGFVEELQYNTVTGDLLTVIVRPDMNTFAALVEGFTEQAIGYNPEQVTLIQHYD